MPDLDWNREVWNSRENWPELGEGWSAPWGSSESQWFGTLLPRLRRLLPARRILEIAPGYGRWTKFLIPACSQYLGIDISGQCVEACADRFRHAGHARFVQNDGFSLAEAEDSAFDLVFSFDSLVHAEIDVFRSYVPQIIRKLNAGGIAFVHHSNLNGFDNPDGLWSHARALSVSGRNVEELVRENGGRVLVQEIITWITSGPIDCLTTFGLAAAHAEDPTRLVNLHFMEEASFVARYQNPYGRLALRRDAPSAESQEDTRLTARSEEGPPEVLFLQTADRVMYAPLLEITSRTIREYCQRHGCDYESYLGIVRGYYPWHATYNRISLLRRLLETDFRGWICYVDADAFIVDLEFDLRGYLSDKTDTALIIAPGGPPPPWWNVNAGVFLLNLGHRLGRAIVRQWSDRFGEITDDQLREFKDWSSAPEDQWLLGQTLKDLPNAEQHTIVDGSDPPLLNYNNGRFIRQELRAYGNLEERVNRLRTIVGKVLQHGTDSAGSSAAA